MSGYPLEDRYWANLGLFCVFLGHSIWGGLRAVVEVVLLCIVENLIRHARGFPIKRESKDKKGTGLDQSLWESGGKRKNLILIVSRHEQLRLLFVLIEIC